MKKHFIRINLSVLGCAVLAWAGEISANAQAQDYMGASAVLQQVEERHAKPVSMPATNDVSKLQDDLKAFGKNAANLPAANAAKQWLELVDRAAKIDSRSPGMSINGGELLGALPPPTAWKELAVAISARPQGKDQGEIREAGLRLLAAALTGNVAARNLEITNLEAKASQADSQSAMVYAQLFQQLSEAMAAASDDPDAILKSLDYQISASGMGNGSVDVPNLVSQVGEEKAEAFLRRALVAPVSLQFNAPNQTSRLAQKLALGLIDQMKVPQWGLVNSLDAVDLYEALDKRYGAGTNNSPPLPGLPAGMNIPPGDYMGNSSRELAQIYYMLGLISQGRTQDAVAAARKCRADQSYDFDSAFDAMDRAGYAVELDNFLYELLSQNPNLPFWNGYVEFAAKAGQTSRMVALVRFTLARGDLSQIKKAELHQIFFKALLADDDVDEGVQEMRQLIASNDVPLQFGDNYNAGQIGVLLARIGALMTNSEWTEEGIAAAKQWLAVSTSQNSSEWETEPVVVSLAQTLWELHRGPEAESIMADALANVTRPGNREFNAEYWNGNAPARQILGALAVLYFKAGRYDDVLNLLQDSPNWGAKDLSELFNSDPWDDQFSVMFLHTGSSSLPIPYVAAASLAAKGRTEEARRITDALLDNDPALDRGYELLIQLDGTNAVSRLDEMFKADQFQTRPLIWKAHLLQQEGQLDEAGKTVRAAITIDPSDGEQGRGDRMRAYAELADILEARGDVKEADFNRQIVQAIRISEDADQYYLAGLLKRAIAMYQEGLDHFADAYCIQSRMAIQLAALGKTSEAAEHYRRAYELMPDSFGRVESHCFGCERVFNGEQAQSIAEKVFTQLVADRPNKPQVYYLLGYLQSEENHYSAAWTNFQTAVRLDPDYLNAWGELQSAGVQTFVPSAQKEEVAFNILRLDPLGRHSCPDFSSVSDLARLWNAAARAASLRPKPVSHLFPLTASAAAWQKRVNSATEQTRDELTAEEFERGNRGFTPASAVAETPYVNFAGELILNNDLASMDQ